MAKMVNMKVEGNEGLEKMKAMAKGPEAGGRNTKRAAAKGTKPRKG